MEVSEKGRLTNIMCNQAQKHDWIFWTTLWRSQYTLINYFDVVLECNVNSFINEVCEYDYFFLQKKDASKMLGLICRLSRSIKCTALCMLVFIVVANAIDEYCRIKESTATKIMKIL